MRTVTGQKDESMQLLRALRVETGRVEHAAYFFEGSELLRRAFQFGAEVKEVVLEKHFAESDEGQEIAELAVSAGARVSSTTAGLISWALGSKPTPLCIGIAARRTVSISNVLKADKNDLVVVVEHGESADNLGMFLRSAEAAGVTGVILASDTVEPFNRRTVRGSRGAVFTLKLCIYSNAVKAVETAKQRGLQIIGTSAVADGRYTDTDLTVPTLVVIGNEHTGMSDDMKSAVDKTVSIPMAGDIHSLNIAVAGSILLYEAVRQRSLG